MQSNNFRAKDNCWDLKGRQWLSECFGLVFQDKKLRKAKIPSTWEKTCSFLLLLLMKKLSKLSKHLDQEKLFLRQLKSNIIFIRLLFVKKIKFKICFRLLVRHVKKMETKNKHTLCAPHPFLFSNDSPLRKISLSKSKLK